MPVRPPLLFVTPFVMALLLLYAGVALALNALGSLDKLLRFRKRPWRRTGIAFKRKKRYIDPMNNYTIVIHDDLDGGYWAEVPALPGCVSQGDTLDELKNNVREAIEGYLEVMREDGRKPELNIQLAEVAV